MFKLNIVQTTKSGEKLMPFIVSGNTVSCFTKNKEIVYRQLSDFDFSSPPKKNQVVSVLAREEQNTDQLFEDEPVINEISEPVQNDKVISVEPTPVPEPTPEPTPTPVPVPEPEPEPTPEPEPPSTGSIWDNVDDDDYI